MHGLRHLQGRCGGQDAFPQLSPLRRSHPLPERGSCSKPHLHAVRKGRARGPKPRKSLEGLSLWSLRLENDPTRMPRSGNFTK
jgi:hypothetical protein